MDENEACAPAKSGTGLEVGIQIPAKSNELIRESLGSFGFLEPHGWPNAPFLLHASSFIIPD